MTLSSVIFSVPSKYIIKTYNKKKKNILHEHKL